MSATTTITQGASKIPSEQPVNHSYPPTTLALGEHLDEIGASMAATAASNDSSTSRKAALWREKVVFATMCGALFLAGWNDGTTGPLLPRIQEVYHVRL